MHIPVLELLRQVGALSSVKASISCRLTSCYSMATMDVDEFLHFPSSAGPENIAMLCECRHRHLYDYVAMMDVDEFPHFPTSTSPENMSGWLKESLPRASAGLCMQASLWVQVQLAAILFFE
jgi:hypothetical protein